MAAFVSCVVSRISHILHLSGFRSQRPLLSPSLWIAKRLTYASYMDSCHCPVNMMVPPPSRSKIWKQQYGAKRMWGEWGGSGGWVDVRKPTRKEIERTSEWTEAGKLPTTTVKKHPGWTPDVTPFYLDSGNISPSMATLHVDFPSLT